MFYAIYMATRPRACIFHKTLGLMLYLLRTIPITYCILDIHNYNEVLRWGARSSKIYGFMILAFFITNQLKIEGIMQECICIANISYLHTVIQVPVLERSRNEVQCLCLHASIHWVTVSNRRISKRTGAGETWAAGEGCIHLYNYEERTVKYTHI